MSLMTCSVMLGQHEAGEVHECVRKRAKVTSKERDGVTYRAVRL